MLSLDDNVYRQKLRADLYIRQGLNETDLGLCESFLQRRNLRLNQNGYASATSPQIFTFFRNVSNGGMLEEHDRKIRNYSIFVWPDKNDSMRKIVEAVDEFVDVHKILFIKWSKLLERGP